MHPPELKSALQLIHNTRLACCFGVPGTDRRTSRVSAVSGQLEIASCISSAVWINLPAFSYAADCSALHASCRFRSATWKAAAASAASSASAAGLVSTVVSSTSLLVSQLKSLLNWKLSVPQHSDS